MTAFSDPVHDCAPGLRNTGDPVGATCSTAPPRRRSRVRVSRGSVRAWVTVLLAALLAFEAAVLGQQAAAEGPAPEVPKAGGVENEATVGEPPPRSTNRSRNSERSRRRSRNQDGSKSVHIFTPYHLAREQRARDTVVVFGDTVIDGVVDGALVVVGNDLKINGTVRGDVVHPFGSVSLGPEAKIFGNLVVFGGSLERAEGAEVTGDVVPIPFHLSIGNGRLGDWLKFNVKELVVQLRPLSPRVGWVWAVWAGLLLLHGLVVLVFQPAVRRMADTLQGRPVSAFLMGLAAFPFWILLSTLTSPTVAIPIILLVAFPFAVVFGKTAVLHWTGSRVIPAVKSGGIVLGVVAFLVGTLLVTLLYLVPYIGFLTWMLLSTWGLGAALLTMLDAFQSETGTPRPALSVGHLQPRSTGRGEPAILPVIASVPASASAGEPPKLDSESAATLPSAPASLASPELAPVAGFGRRLGATFIDVVLLLFATGWVMPFGLLLWLVYFAGMWVWRGTTVGGIVFGIRVVRRDGRPVDWPTAVVRSIGAGFSTAACFLGYIWAAWDANNEAWHDKLAGTILVESTEARPLV